MQPITAVAIVDKGAPFIRRVIVIVGRADDDVRVAVAVHVPSHPHRPAKACADLVALGGPVRRGGKPHRRAVIDVGLPFIRLVVVVVARAGDDVRVTVAVHVPSRPHRMAKVGANLVALGGPVRRGGKPRRRAVIDVGSPLIRLAVVVVGRADDDVAVTVAVHVPGRPHRIAKLSAGLVALGGPGGRGVKPSRRAVVYIGPPFFIVCVVV